MSRKFIGDDKWILKFKQPHDAITIQVSATLSSKSMDRLGKVLKDPTMSGSENKFIAVANRNLIFAGYMMGGYFTDYTFPDIQVPVKMPVKKIVPCQDGCEVLLYASEVGMVTYKSTGLCFKEIMFGLFGKTSQNELHDYLQLNHVVAEVYNGIYICMPIPIPAIEISAEAIIG